jgi:hypothetical protein
MDKLDQEIADKRAAVDRLRAELRSAEIELAAFERAAQLRPDKATHPGPASSKGGGFFLDTEAPEARRGRQPGAISHEWRRVLELIISRLGGSATPEQIAALGGEVGLPTLTAALVRQRMTLYQSYSHDYVRLASDGKYHVTNKAVERFGLSPLPHAISEGAMHENEGDSATST